MKGIEVEESETGKFSSWVVRKDVGKTPAIYNKTLTSVDTEYSQALPDHTKKLTFQCRTAFDVRFAFETGKVATPTAPYGTIKANGAYDEKDLDLVSKTLYLGCGSAGKVVEIVVYT